MERAQQWEELHDRRHIPVVAKAMLAHLEHGARLMTRELARCNERRCQHHAPSHGAT